MLISNQLRKSVTELQKHSLLEGEGHYQMHGVIQSTIRELLAPEQNDLRDLLEVKFNELFQLEGQCPLDYNLCRTLFPHISAYLASVVVDGRNNEIIVSLYERLAKFSEFQDQQNQANEFYQKALNLCEARGSSEVPDICKIGSLFLALQHRDKARENYDQALSLKLKQLDGAVDLELADIHYNLAVVNSSSERALFYATEALRIKKIILQNKGGSKADEEKVREAESSEEDAFEDLADIYFLMGVIKRSDDSSNHLNSIYEARKLLEIARECYKKQLSRLQETYPDKPHVCAPTIRLMAETFEFDADFNPEPRIELLEILQNTPNLEPNHVQIFDANIAIAHCYKIKGDQGDEKNYVSAIEYYNKALELAQLTTDQSSLAAIYYELALCYGGEHQMQDIDKMFVFACIALDFCPESAKTEPKYYGLVYRIWDQVSALYIHRYNSTIASDERYQRISGYLNNPGVSHFEKLNLGKSELFC